MSGPFKMKGSSGLGYGNQHSKGKGVPMIGEIVKAAGGIMGKKEASPAKNDDDIAKKKRVVEMNEKHAGKPGFEEYKNKVFGGKTEIKDGISKTVKPIKS